ncbi:MAG TPA: hypothetical protein VKR58_10485, partial [Aquella sp.]|nr:hypothetical protein [Aquella sp.]
MINSLQKNYILFLFLSLFAYTPSLSKSSGTPEITMHWSTSDNHPNGNHSHRFKNFLKNHFSYNIRATQPSYNNNHHHIHNINTYYNPYIAYMSISDFQQIFASISNKYEILNNYALYAYPNFRSFARGLPCYEEFILSLHTKIKNDKNFKVPSDFCNFICNEANTIRNKQNTAQPYSAEATKGKQ